MCEVVTEVLQEISGNLSTPPSGDTRFSEAKTGKAALAHECVRVSNVEQMTVRRYGVIPKELARLPCNNLDEC